MRKAKWFCTSVPITAIAKRPKDYQQNIVVYNTWTKVYPRTNNQTNKQNGNMEAKDRVKG